MLNHSDIMSTVDMIDHQHLDIRTITMGISLLDCADPNPEACARKVHDKICRQAEHLVATGCQIERELGIPIVNKRISVTPIALVASACETEDFVPFAKAMDSAAKTCGVDFIGGFSALVQKGMASGDRRLIAAIPQALAETELVCSSVNIASTKAGINMDAVRLMGQAIKKTAELTKERDGLGCAKLVVFCNAVEDNPFMAGAFHGVGEADAVVSVGVSGPGVVCTTRCRASRAGPLTRWPSASRKRPSASRVWASWWRGKRPGGWACRSAWSTCPSPRHPPWATAWRAFWRKWALKPAGRMERRRHWRFSMTRSRRAG